MKKAEYIARYGEEGWARQLERQRESAEKRKMGIVAERYEAPKTLFSFKISQPAPQPDEDIPQKEIQDNVRGKVEKTAAFLQKAIRKEWVQRHRERNIIIVTPGAIKNKKTIKYEIELYQLNMSKELKKEFEKVCRDIMEKPHIK